MEDSKLWLKIHDLHVSIQVQQAILDNQTSKWSNKDLVKSITKKKKVLIEMENTYIKCMQNWDSL